LVYKNPISTNFTIIQATEQRFPNNFNIIINNTYNNYNYNVQAAIQPIDGYRIQTAHEDFDDYIDTFNYSLSRDMKEDFTDDMSLMNAVEKPSPSNLIKEEKNPVDMFFEL
jgi:hypothetical protein